MPIVIVTFVSLVFLIHFWSPTTGFGGLNVHDSSSFEHPGYESAYSRTADERGELFIRLADVLRCIGSAWRISG